ncbi:MAG: exodeoxyribonuclease alpha subunit, partial [Pseudonocardiales bacterium]|nr:exodeoxyribonuclease alpha subunit [Pseudonocardiales bacterium]
MGQLRAGRLLSAFIAAQPAYDLVELMLTAGLPARLAGRAVEAFGSGAQRLLKDDPWRLLQLSGIEVADADAFARAAIPGVLQADSRRSRALVGWSLSEAARDGHTLCSVEQVTFDLQLHRVADPVQAIADACGAEIVESIDSVVDSGLALARYAEAERSIAAAVHRLTDSATVIGKIRAGKRRKSDAIDPDGLDPVQRSAVDNALDHGVSVLTGGPGTGKSRTVATVVREAERAGKSVALAAPTGRAAKRLAELCDAEAMTIHRLLGVQPRASTSADGTSAVIDFSAGFARGQEWPLDQDLVVVDEASMLDVELAAALLKACADGTHLMIVGDSAQLPSIGPGQVLADLIASKAVPVVELATLYRQDAGGAIARLATAVRGGDLPAVDSPDREVVIVPARGSTECAHRVVQLMTDSIPRALGIAAGQIQVVTPVHRGPAGTIALNAALKAKLNPPPANQSFGRFDPGDRVVATANHLEAEPVGYANGEVGVVSEVGRDGTVTVDFASGPATVKGKALADLTHGWAITVHRAQGSEFPAVVVVAPGEATGMLSR